MDRRLDSLRSSDLCDEATHLSPSSWLQQWFTTSGRCIYAGKQIRSMSMRHGEKNLGAGRGRFGRAERPGAAVRGLRASCGRFGRAERPGAARMWVTGELRTVLFGKPSKSRPRFSLGRVVDVPSPRPTQKNPHRGRGSRKDVMSGSRYWMRVRQYGQTFQSAFSGRWQVGQTLRTCVLQIGQTTKSRSMGAPHLGQMP